MAATFVRNLNDRQIVYTAKNIEEYNLLRNEMDKERHDEAIGVLIISFSIVFLFIIFIVWFEKRKTRI